MAGFSLDFEDVFEGRIQDGTYEVIVSNVKEDATPGGAEFIDMVLVVRNDIEQKYQNTLIFHKIWKSKETGKFNQKSFNTIGAALQLQNGKQYGSLNDLLEDFVMKTCRVTVKNEESEYKGKNYKNVNVKQWLKTNSIDKVQHVFKKKEKSMDSANDKLNDAFGSSTQIDISDDDLPF